MRTTTTLRCAALVFATALAGSSFLGEPRADAPPGRYLDSDCGGTPCVKDTQTGLYWKRSEESGTYPWSEAKGKCPSSFRLPTIRELQTLLDETRPSAPLVDAAHFPGATSDWFWSSTPQAAAPSVSAWGLTFAFGNTFIESTAKMGHVRCVR